MATPINEKQRTHSTKKRLTSDVIKANELASIYFNEFAIGVSGKESLSLSIIFEFKEQMKALANGNEIINLAKTKFSHAMSYLFTRILELIDLFEPEDGDEISMDSLKSMLLFLFCLQQFQRPKMTLNENGTFQLNWKRDNDNLMTLRFKENDFLDYVIFKTSSYVNRPIVLNGTMNILDFKDYLMTLNLKFHIL